jgi:NTE family protein
MARIGLVLGAGGVVGGAFHDGVLRALNDATGWDPRSAEVIVGTSAGSHVGAMLRAGRPARGRAPLGRTAEAGGSTPRSGRGPASPGLLVRGLTRPGSVRAGALVAAALPAGRTSFEGVADHVDRAHPHGWPERSLWLPAVRLRDGARVVFGHPDAPVTSVGRAVAASCAIPGHFQPVAIDGERYVDGGVHSTTNLDLLAGQSLDLVVVSAPMAVARGAFSPSALLQGRSYMRLRMGSEARAVRRSGTPVVAFSPTADDMGVMGWNAMASSRRRAVVDRAYASAARRLDDPRWQEELAALTG